jgi:hypothetical protein
MRLYIANRKALAKAGKPYRDARAWMSGAESVTEFSRLSEVVETVRDLALSLNIVWVIEMDNGTIVTAANYRKYFLTRLT